MGSKIWFTSDPHFQHKNVIRFCGRPFETVDEMNEAIIESWNDSVSPEDTVYVLGDVFFCGTQLAQKIMARLNGRKILIRGNHDQTHEKMLKYGFAESYDQLVLPIAGQDVVLCHFPYAPTKFQQALYRLRNCWKLWLHNRRYTELRFMDLRPTNLGGWLLHGHVHQLWQRRGKQINVGVDVWGFAPVSLEQIERIILGTDKL